MPISISAWTEWLHYVKTYDMRHFLLIIAILFAPSIVTAQTNSNPAPNPYAMKNFKVTSPAHDETSNHPVPHLTTPKQPTAPLLKPLKIDDAIKSMDDIPAFESMHEFLSLGHKDRNDARITRARDIVTNTPDAVPPLAYYYLARALADNNDFESAVFYFYVAELRNEFDRARFPVYQLKKPDADKPTMLTQNQIGAVPSSAPRIIDPRGGYNDLIKNLGAPIRAWVVKHPDEFRTILARVKLWDEATAYAYRPPYDISGAVDVKAWPSLLTKTRSAFFATQQSVAGELETIDNFTPPRPFGR